MTFMPTVNLREPYYLAAVIYHSNGNQLVLMRNARMCFRDDDDLLCAGGCVNAP